MRNQHASRRDACNLKGSPTERSTWTPASHLAAPCLALALALQELLATAGNFAEDFLHNPIGTVEREGKKIPSLLLGGSSLPLTGGPLLGALAQVLEGPIQNTVRTFNTAIRDTEAAVQKAGNDAYATYVKAWRDGEREARTAVEDAAEAVNAAARFQERQMKAYVENLQRAERRLREGKVIDAAWHVGSDRLGSDEENFFKATQESKVINAAASSAAAAYGGPGGAAAYASWSAYRTTGDVNFALRAGMLAGATAQAGTYTEKMPDGTLGQVAKKATVAGAMGGIAVAAAGGDEQAITKAFLASGGTVIVQRSKDAVNGYSPKAKAALQIVDCVSARDTDCFSKTQYAKDGAKFIRDKVGKPVLSSQPVQAGVRAWTTVDRASPEGRRLAEIARNSKLPGREAIPVLNNQYLLTWALDAKGSAPAVVLTEVGKRSPYLFKTHYTRSDEAAKLAAERVLQQLRNHAAVVKTVRYVCTIQGEDRTIISGPGSGGVGCESSYNRPGHPKEVLWIAGKLTDKCLRRAEAQVTTFRRQGFICR